jgi:hypothetical protein
MTLGEHILDLCVQICDGFMLIRSRGSLPDDLCNGPCDFYETRNPILRGSSIAFEKRCLPPPSPLVHIVHASTYARRRPAMVSSDLPALAAGGGTYNLKRRKMHILCSRCFLVFLSPCLNGNCRVAKRSACGKTMKERSKDNEGEFKRQSRRASVKTK